MLVFCSQRASVTTSPIAASLIQLSTDRQVTEVDALTASETRTARTARDVGRISSGLILLTRVCRATVTESALNLFSVTARDSAGVSLGLLVSNAIDVYPTTLDFRRRDAGT